MGLRKLFGKIFGSAPDETEPEVVKLEGRNTMDDTLIFTGQPDYNATIGIGDGPKVSPAVIEQMQKEDARISAQNLIPGQVTNLGRGVGNNPMQPPPQNMQMQQYQPQQFQQPPQQFQQPQFQQQSYQYMQAPQQYQQQPQQYQEPQNIPISGQGSQYFIEEPYSELVLTNTECHVIVDLPGVKSENIDISLTQENDVQITFTRTPFVDSIKPSVKGAKGKRPKIESQLNVPDFIIGKHTVSYHIPRAVDDKKIKCSFELGQVHVVLGLRASVEGVKINIT